MSLPRPSHASSHSASKSSLRRTSGSRNSSNPSLGPPPTTHFAAEATQRQYLPHSPPNQNLDYDEDEEVAIQDSSSYNDSRQQAQDPPQPQIPFHPFFTLIEDSLTTEHHHPTVHYIFADDEQDIITEAACRALEQDSDSQPQSSSQSQSQSQPQTHSHTQPDQDEHVSHLPPADPNIRDHYLILDVEPTQPQSPDPTPAPSPHPSRPGSISASPTPNVTRTRLPYTITSTTSLSPFWQPTRALLTDAPTMNPDSPTETRIPAAKEHKREQHLMLRIEGRGNTPPEEGGRAAGESMEDMIERLGRRLSEVRSLIAEAEEDEGAFGGELVSGAEEGRMFGRAVLEEGPGAAAGTGGGGLDEQD